MHAFVVPAEGGTPRQVTSGDFQHGGQVYGGGAVTWSADGNELLLAARRGENPEWTARETDLFAFSYDDFRLTGYDPHPHIAAAVAV